MVPSAGHAITEVFNLPFSTLPLLSLSRQSESYPHYSSAAPRQSVGAG
jgi:hypothetical protein